MASATWTLTQIDIDAVGAALARLLKGSGAHTAMVVDRSGQLVTVAGRPVEFDTTSFATLAAADFSANDQLARLIGEADFTSLAHEGANESLYFVDIAHRLLLVVLFDKQTTLAIVRMLAPAVAQDLTLIFNSALSRDNTGGIDGQGLLRGAENEIDNLFA
jgi:predicted regulator of Ras-like GTPase activity (Roadblock/LC7/MglB family)